MSCICVPPRCTNPRRRRDNACRGPYAPQPGVDQPPLYYLIPDSGGIYILQNGSTGGIPIDNGLLPSILNVPFTVLPGANPPCCTTGSNLEIIGFTADRGGAAETPEFGISLQQDSLDPLTWSLNIGTPPPATPLVFALTHWVLVRYCTCGYPPLYSAIAIYPTNPGLNPPRDPAYLQSLGLTFTPCP